MYKIYVKTNSVTLLVQLEQEVGDVVIGSHNLGSTKDKFAGIPHDELALKTEGNQTPKALFTLNVCICVFL